MKTEKLSDYLYYLELNTYNFEPMPALDSPMFTFGCSTVRKGNLLGRNLDLTYCCTPEFVIRLGASGDRFASINVCANPTITDDVSEMTEDDLLSMPNITNDGINEKGVIASVHVVKTTGVDDMSGTNPGREKVHASRIVRYILDHAESAAHAVELLNEIDITGGFSGYGLHWMVADSKDTYIVEIIGGKLSVGRNEHFYMTNFYMNLGPSKDEQTACGKIYRNLPLLSDYAIGIERWCIMRDAYDDIESADDMAELLEALKASNQYDFESEPVRYSDYVDEYISIHGDTADFERKMEAERELFLARDRKDPKGDWITWHSSVYDMDMNILYVYSQEDYSRAFTFEGPETN